MKNYSSSMRRAEEILLGFEKKVKSGSASGGGGGYRGGKVNLKPNTGIKNLTAAAKGKQEVMLKIPKRNSANSNNTKGVMNHISYISRNGKLELEDKDGHKLNGTKAREEITAKWRKLGLIDDVSGKKQTMNIVLSMSKGVKPEAVLKAGRDLAKELFNENHEYVFALHNDTDNPHVHLTVTMMGYDGQRLNPKKQDLFKWRLLFAEKLREHGVECAATRRQHRGQFQKQENNVLKRMGERNAESFINQRKLNALKEAIKENKRPIHPFLKEQLNTQQLVLKEYKALSKQLYQEGFKSEAKAISQLAKKLETAQPVTQDQTTFDNVKKGRYPIGYKVNLIFEELKSKPMDKVMEAFKEELNVDECKQLAKRCYINGLKTESKKFSELAKEKINLQDIVIN